MRRVLVDVNVVLDVLFDRQPHARAAGSLWKAVEAGRIEALLPAHGLTTAYYLAARHGGAAFARRVTQDLVAVFGVAPVDGKVIRRALALEWPDFEDAVCTAAAEASGCDAIVTRDPTDFRGSPVDVLEPALALVRLDETD